MARIYFMAAFIALAALASAAPKIDSIDARIISTFSDLSHVPKIPTNGEVRYAIGARVAGDRLVEQSGSSHTFPNHQDVQLNLNYPKSGTGATVSYVEVYVKSDSIVGAVDVVSGGIGTRQISVVVKAKNASYFTYTAQIYGH